MNTIFSPPSKKRELAPIVLFVYNRPWHTRQTVESLKINEYASKSDIFIYSDGPKNEKSVNTVNAVRKYINSISGFRSIKVIKRTNNWGLADNIINGVTEIVNTFGRIIVLEDDLVTCPSFLRFMNDALEHYKNTKKVMHISGWNYPINPEDLPDTFFWRVMNCWGWATWKDRWKYFERNPELLYKSLSIEEIWRFNLDDAHNFWDQVKRNFEGNIKTWAIYWYATIFKKRGLCLNPTLSLVQNIGHDGSGTNCGKAKKLFISKNTQSRNQKTIFPNQLLENKEATFYIKKYLSRNSNFYKIEKFLCKLIFKIYN